MKKKATCTITINSKTSTGATDSENGDWTDFSNAKFELKKDGTSRAIIEISNVTPKTESKYYLFITSNNSKPNVTSDNTDESITLSYDSDSKMFTTTNGLKVAKYVELNQDLYGTIFEIQSYTNEKVVIYGKKLERYAEPKYSDAFFATFMSDDCTQLITAFTHSEENNRKIQIKVGKVTDTSILQKIKNQDSSGFEDLLSLAKSGEKIYNNTIVANKDYYAIAYIAGEASVNEENSVISLSGLQEGEYYFLYIKADDENGKYISQEAVTLAQADVLSDDYGSSDFKWADFSNVEQDDTIAKVTLPNAGIDTITWMALCIVLVVGVISYKQYRKNNL